MATKKDATKTLHEVIAVLMFDGKEQAARFFCMAESFDGAVDIVKAKIPNVIRTTGVGIVENFVQ